MYNVFIYYFVYPILAPSIIFLSSSCAVLTSFETTKALSGCWDCPAITSANWSVAPAPTMLNAGACAGVGSFVLIFGFVALPPDLSALSA